MSDQSKQRVLEVWPDAICVEGVTRWEILSQSYRGGRHVLGVGLKEHTAWADAASKLPTASPVTALVDGAVMHSMPEDEGAGEIASEDAEYVRLRDKYNSVGLNDAEYQRWRALDDARRSSLQAGTHSVLGYDGEQITPKVVPEPVPAEGAHSVTVSYAGPNSKVTAKCDCGWSYIGSWQQSGEVHRQAAIHLIPSAPEAAAGPECVDCRDYKANIRRWITQLGGNAEAPHISVELERLIDSLAESAAPVSVVKETEQRLRNERDDWRRRYFEMEAALSRCIDTNGDHIKRIQRLEREKDEIRNQARIDVGRASKFSVSGAQIKGMVDRFLSWRLPENFNPDGGISFKRSETAIRYNHPWPTGANFLDAQQAEQMVLHMIEGLPAAPIAPATHTWTQREADFFAERNAAWDKLRAAQEVIEKLEKALEPFPGNPRFYDEDEDTSEWGCMCCDASAKLGSEIAHDDDCVTGRAHKALARAESYRKQEAK